MAGKITLTFTDGKKRILKRAEDLAHVDKAKMVYLVFGATRIFTGYTDGSIDSDGNIIVDNPYKVFDVKLPLNELIGWAYR